MQTSSLVRSTWSVHIGSAVLLHACLMVCTHRFKSSDVEHPPVSVEVHLPSRDVRVSASSPPGQCRVKTVVLNNQRGCYAAKYISVSWTRIDLKLCTQHNTVMLSNILIFFQNNILPFRSRFTSWDRTFELALRVRKRCAASRRSCWKISEDVTPRSISLVVEHLQTWNFAHSTTLSCCVTYNVIF